MNEKADIWLPLNIGDYLRDTMHFTAEEHGAYLLLIMAYHMNRGPLPDDDRCLRNIAKISRHKWSKIRQTLASKFCIENGLWHHKRCDAELRKAADFREKRRAQTEAARKARAAKTDTVTDSVTRDTTTTTTTDSSLRSESDLFDRPANGHAKPDTTDKDFEAFWSAYPHPPNRGSKKVAREAFSKRVRDPTAVMRGVSNYAAYLATSDWQRPAMAQTWINQERWAVWQEAKRDEQPGRRERVFDASELARIAGIDGDAGRGLSAGGDVRPETERRRIEAAKR